MTFFQDELSFEQVSFATLGVNDPGDLVIFPFSQLRINAPKVTDRITFFLSTQEEPLRAANKVKLTAEVIKLFIEWFENNKPFFNLPEAIADFTFGIYIPWAENIIANLEEQKPLDTKLSNSHPVTTTVSLNDLLTYILGSNTGREVSISFNITLQTLLPELHTQLKDILATFPHNRRLVIETTLERALDGQIEIWYRNNEPIKIDSSENLETVLRKDFVPNVLRRWMQDAITNTPPFKSTAQEDVRERVSGLLAKENAQLSDIEIEKLLSFVIANILKLQSLDRETIYTFIKLSVSQWLSARLGVITRKITIPLKEFEDFLTSELRNTILREADAEELQRFLDRLPELKDTVLSCLSHDTIEVKGDTVTIKPFRDTPERPGMTTPALEYLLFVLPECRLTIDRIRFLIN